MNPEIFVSDHKQLVDQLKMNSAWSTSDIEVDPTMDFLENHNGIYSYSTVAEICSLVGAD